MMRNECFFFRDLCKKKNDCACNVKFFSSSVRHVFPFHIDQACFGIPQEESAHGLDCTGNVRREPTAVPLQRMRKRFKELTAEAERKVRTSLTSLLDIMACLDTNEAEDVKWFNVKMEEHLDINLYMNAGTLKRALASFHPEKGGIHQAMAVSGHMLRPQEQYQSAGARQAAPLEEFGTFHSKVELEAGRRYEDSKHVGLGGAGGDPEELNKEQSLHDDVESSGQIQKRARKQAAPHSRVPAIPDLHCGERKHAIFGSAHSRPRELNRRQALLKILETDSESSGPSKTRKRKQAAPRRRASDTPMPDLDCEKHKLAGQESAGCYPRERKMDQALDTNAGSSGRIKTRKRKQAAPRHDSNIPDLNCEELKHARLCSAHSDPGETNMGKLLASDEKSCGRIQKRKESKLLLSVMFLIFLTWTVKNLSMSYVAVLIVIKEN